MYKIDFEIKIIANSSNVDYLERQLYDRIFEKISFGEYGRYAMSKIATIGMSKENNENYGYIIGSVFLEMIRPSHKLEERVQEIYTLNLRRKVIGFSDKMIYDEPYIIETRINNVVWINRIYYNIFIEMKEKIQSAFSGLKQKFLC